MLIHLRCRYGILGEVFFRPDASRFRFSVPVQDSTPVVVEIVAEASRIESFQQVVVSEEMWDFLQTGASGAPSALRDELSTMTSAISSATKKVLGRAKYGLGWTTLDERLVSSEGAEWSADEVEWKRLPTLLQATVWDEGFHVLSDSTASAILQCIEGGFRTLSGTEALAQGADRRHPPLQVD
jgi:hypothetical protein